MGETERRARRARMSYEQSTRLWWARVGLGAIGAISAVVIAANSTMFLALVLVAFALLGTFVGGFSYAEWLRSQGKTSWCWGDPASRRR